MVAAAVVLTAVVLLKPMVAPTRLVRVDPLPTPCNTGGELDIAGAFNDCAAPVFDARVPCMDSVPAHDFQFTVRLHGARHDFLLYIEILGGYQGPQQYALRPWPQAALGDRDGVPKVAVREYITGDFWGSAEGLLRISTNGSSGIVSATLSPPGGAQAGLQDMRIDGHWQCG